MSKYKSNSGARLLILSLLTLFMITLTVLVDEQLKRNKEKTNNVVHARTMNQNDLLYHFNN
ncbi:hypothetical protein EI427_23350 [Flammeovirga pectinis]|uniref:Uncharacterized protein n=1 Tax=Flammeovirga pectinis TaxID=2494373 RepID=A0A3S9PAQ7_9BACT|nr:hypothetical protein [Flammeovirga pectinis]AZQ65152.1 hypothetical protein EI427_23350 [Flammeovirga pectinis]